MSWSKLRSLNKADQFGAVSAGFGFLQQGIGAYYAASAEKYKTKSLALSLQHKKDMALFNRDMKESQAQYLNRVYNQRYMQRTLKQGGDKSTAKTQFAARGIQMGVGSTKDAFVSSEILAEIDKITMNSNKVRAVENKRLEGVGLAINADMYGLSANNAFATASSISPWMNMGSSLLTGSANLVSSLPKSLFS
tara:strand:+ start:41 stop:619 length:579 start_codon:yes stop_codon:yes gene_type:complete